MYLIWFASWKSNCQFHLIRKYCNWTLSPLSSITCIPVCFLFWLRMFSLINFQVVCLTFCALPVMNRVTFYILRKTVFMILLMGTLQNIFDCFWLSDCSISKGRLHFGTWKTCDKRDRLSWLRPHIWKSKVTKNLTPHWFFFWWGGSRRVVKSQTSILEKYFFSEHVESF